MKIDFLSLFNLIFRMLYTHIKFIAIQCIRDHLIILTFDFKHALIQYIVVIRHFHIAIERKTTTK